MSVLRPDILVIGRDPAGVECALGAAAARVPVVLVTQDEAPRPAGGLDPLNRLAAMGGRILEGRARFRDRNHLFVDGMTLAPRRVVLALPARAPACPVPGLEAAPRWAPGLPATAVLVIGPGARLPAQLHAVRLEGHRALAVTPGPLLPGADAEGAQALADHLRRAGVELHAHTPLEGAAVRPCPEGFLLHPAQGAPIGFSHWVDGTQAPPDLEGLALEEAGVALAEGRVRCGAGLASTNSAVLALGATRTINADPLLARAEAGIALASLLMRVAPEKALARLPRLVHGPLTLAEAGESEAALEARGRGKTRLYRVPMAGGGMLKACTDARGRLLRYTVLAAHAPGFIGPLDSLLARGEGLAGLAGLPLPALEEAQALADLGRMAVLEQAGSPFARLMLRLLRWLG